MFGIYDLNLKFVSDFGFRVLDLRCVATVGA